MQVRPVVTRSVKPVLDKLLFRLDISIAVYDAGICRAIAEVCLTADLGCFMGVVHACKVGRALAVSLAKLGRDPRTIDSRTAAAEGIEVSVDSQKKQWRRENN